MAKFIINGGIPLKGAVRIGGAKNASFKLMIAASLALGESRLLNLSNIGDVRVTQKTLKTLGVQIKRCGERTVYVRPKGMKSFKVPQFSGEKTRASTLYAAMLLAKLGKARIPLPGGCVLGARPIDRHLEGLKNLGVEINCGGKWIDLKTNKLRGSRYKFSKKSHTGTEAMILAAVLAIGRTRIENAALEPEIDDLINFLNKMGAKIKRAYKSTIIVDGVRGLRGAIYKIMPDRNEAVSYAVAALLTKGDVIVEDARQEHIRAFLGKLEEAGGSFNVENYGIRFWYQKPLRATNIKTAPEPGFMTDWQPLWTLLMTQARGNSRIIEAVHDNRFQYIKQLTKMGAKITFFNPKVADPDRYYEFDIDNNQSFFHAVKVLGPTKFKASKLEVPDLRAGATLAISALAAQGRSQISGVEQIDRGYEDLEEKLAQLGAKIKRID